MKSRGTLKSCRPSALASSQSRDAAPSTPPADHQIVGFASAGAAPGAIQVDAGLLSRIGRSRRCGGDSYPCALTANTVVTPFIPIPMMALLSIVQSGRAPESPSAQPMTLALAPIKPYLPAGIVRTRLPREATPQGAAGRSKRTCAGGCTRMGRRMGANGKARAPAPGEHGCMRTVTRSVRGSRILGSGGCGRAGSRCGSSAIKQNIAV
jgi:hypothetical protein